MNESLSNLPEKSGGFLSKLKTKHIVIIAAVVILLIIPLGIILSIHSYSHDCSFEYVKVDDIVTEIANKHVYYSAKDKSVQVQLDQDLINSIIKDNLASIELPEGFTIKEVKFNTEEQTVYINAKYGIMNVPLSAKLNVNVQQDGVQILTDNIKLGWMGAPGFVTNQIPKDILNFSFKYEELDIPQVFAVSDVKFTTGNVKITAVLYEDQIAQLAVDYRNDLMKEIDNIKSQGSEILATFLDKLLSEDSLSDDKVKEYVYAALNNEELVNSAIHFAVAGDMDKYAKGIEDVQETVQVWAEPLSTIKFYGNLDDTVDNILYNNELKDFLTWFLPSDQISEYTNTAEDYYTRFKGARTALDGLDIENWEAALDKVLYADEIFSFLELLVSRDDIDKYVNPVKDSYSKIKGGKASLESTFTYLNEGDYDTAVVKLTKDKNIKGLLTLFMSQKDVDNLLGQIDDVYAQYNDIKASLDATVEGIDVELTNEYVDLLIEFAKDLKGDKEYMMNEVDALDPDKIRELVEYLENDQGTAGDFLDDIDPDNYEAFKDELPYLEDYKADTYEFLLNADFEKLDDYIRALEDIKELAQVLKQKDYEKALEIYDRGNIDILISEN